MKEDADDKSTPPHLGNKFVGRCLLFGQNTISVSKFKLLYSLHK